MLTDFIRAAMRREALELCRVDLQEALEDWLIVGLRLGHTIPILDDIDLNVNTAA